MSFAEGLLRRIDSPDQPELRALQQQAIDAVRPIVADADIPDVSEGVIRRLSYTYYYDWETDDPEYMWLVQDPGNLHERHLAELRWDNPLADGCTPREQVSVYRQFGKSWLTGGRNEDFSEKVLTALSSQLEYRTHSPQSLDSPDMSCSSAESDGSESCAGRVRAGKTHLQRAVSPSSDTAESSQRLYPGPIQS